jgi:hypothetical protein
VTCSKAVGSESSRTEHEMLLKSRDGTYGNSPSLSLSLWELKANCTAPGNKSTGLHLSHKTLEHHLAPVISIVKADQTRQSWKTLESQITGLGARQWIGFSSSSGAHGRFLQDHYVSNAISRYRIRYIEHFKEATQSGEHVIPVRLQGHTSILTMIRIIRQTQSVGIQAPEHLRNQCIYGSTSHADLSRRAARRQLHERALDTVAIIQRVHYSFGFNLESVYLCDWITSNVFGTPFSFQFLPCTMKSTSEVDSDPQNSIQGTIVKQVSFRFTSREEINHHRGFQ